jgi:hypothetical protein
MSGQLLSLLSGEQARTPEEIMAANERTVKSLIPAPNAALSMPLALAFPDRNLPGPILNNIPAMGVAEAYGGMLNFLGTHGANILNKTFGLNIPNPPEFLKNAGEHFEETRADIKEGIANYSGGVLPEPNMNTLEGTFADVLGTSLASGVGVGPPALARAVTRLAPYGTKTIAGALVAPLSTQPEMLPRLAAINLGVGGAQEAISNIVDPQPEAVTEMQPVPAGTELPVPPIPPAVIPPPSPAKEEAALTLPSISNPFISSAEAATPKQPAPASISDTFQAPAPTSTNSISDTFQEPVTATFTQQGVTGTPVWQSLAEVAAGVLGIIGGRKLYRKGAEYTQAARDARIADPDFAARVNDYNAEVIARGPGTPAIPPGGEPVTGLVPQGNVVRRGAVYTADKLVNEAARDQNYIKLTSDNPNTAERLAAAVGNMYDTQLSDTKVRQFMRTGFDRDTGIQIPSPAKWVADHATLPVARQSVIDQGLQALNEQDNRVRNRRAFAAANPGRTPTNADTRHDLIGKTDADLNGMVAAMRSDPQLREMEERYKAIHNGIIDIGGHSAYGFFDAGEVGNLKSQRPNYVAEHDLHGRLMHPLGPRDTSALTGQAQMSISPAHAMGNHIERLYPLFTEARIKAQLMDHMLDWQRSPGAPKFITPVNAPTGHHASYYASPFNEIGGQPRDPIITIRKNGAKQYRIDDPDGYHIFNSKGDSAARVRLDVIGKLRQAYTKGTTGIASLATGRATPIRNMFYTPMAGAVNMTREGYAGYTDRFVKQRLGIDSSLARAADMWINPPATMAHYAVDVANRQFTRRMAELTHPSSPSIWNQYMRSMLDPATANSIHNAMMTRWQNSNAAWRQSQYLEGHGSPVKVDAPGIVAGKGRLNFNRNADIGYRSEMARLVPQSYFAKNWLGFKPKAIQLHNMIGEAYGNMNDAGVNFFADINRRNPNLGPERLTYEMRNIAGNPGRKGSGKLMGGLNTALPWLNISAQGIGRAWRAKGERPIGTPVTLAMGLGSMAAAVLLTAMRSPEHMDWLQNQLSLQQREANVPLSLNDDPTKPTMLPLEQDLRLSFAYMLDLMSKTINIAAAKHDPDVFKAIWEGLTNFLGGHITNSNADAMTHATIDQYGVVNLPPYLGSIDYNGIVHGKGIIDAYRPPAGGGYGKGVPGEGADAPLDSKNGKIFEDMLSTVIGSVAHALVDMPNNTYRYHTQGHGWLDSAGMAGRDWLHNTRQANLPFNNVVMETQMRLSLNPPIAAALRPTLDDLIKLPTKSQPSREGFTSGKMPLPVPETVNKAVSNDPYMQHMLIVANGWKNRIDKAMEPIKQIKTQMHGVEKQGMDPARRTAWLNDQTRVMTDKYKLVDAYVQDMYWNLSKLAGKDINKLSDIRWNEGREQFAK